MPNDDVIPNATADSDALTEQVLDVFAAEANIERSRLTPDARADQLGVGSLDLALAIFAIEDRFGIELPEILPGAHVPTVRELVQQVRTGIASRAAAAGTT